VGEVLPDLDLSTWNGLFLKTGTPPEVREKLSAVAEKVMQSDAAKELAAQTGALVYWTDAAASQDQIATDTETLARISAAID
jgi:tripartite-type tricarboxylate transporter receptor subunit TctC